MEGVVSTSPLQTLQLCGRILHQPPHHSVAAKTVPHCVRTAESKSKGTRRLPLKRPWWRERDELDLPVSSTYYFEHNHAPTNVSSGVFSVRHEKHIWPNSQIPGGSPLDRPVPGNLSCRFRCGTPLLVTSAWIPNGEHQSQEGHGAHVILHVYFVGDRIIFFLYANSKYLSFC